MLPPIFVGGLVIPAYVPAEAVFVNQHKMTSTLPVHAWDDEGYALVLWRGKLQRAQNQGGFKEVRDRQQVVAAVPGGGWMTEWQDKTEGTAFADPVVAWAVYSDGYAVAIDTDSSGEAAPLSPSGATHRRIYHPDQVPDGPLGKETGPE
ncbi:hypothetical protein [Streptomyces sp. KN37]|uniref:hypothetical protein n=1 Tax=Streptomyces sp. KN37 TaxID=3090667 RepID=UPI002A74C422|nr:hypothetical protein [Streptomyces sp. KN37]WPO76198.1 hypothetical protein R9806_36560 [Streptomyces sp. KN37]